MSITATPAAPASRGRPAPRGLATLALLKTRFDQGKDHLGLLEPFVADAVCELGKESFVPTELAPVVEQRTGLTIPSETIRTVLGRLSRRRYIRREGGRFLAIQLLKPSPSLEAARQAIMEQQLRFAHVFREYASEYDVKIQADEEALITLATFVADNKISLVLDEPLADSPLDRSSLPRKVTRVVARFIAERCLTSSELRPIVEGLTEGMVLQDALLLRDIAQLGRRFDGLQAYLDSHILFAAIDLTGIASGIATREGLAVLRDSGAVTLAFEKTVGEMRRILEFYERRLATAEGRVSLNPTPLARYALTSHLTPSDIRTIAATLEKRLAAVGVTVRSVPKHDARYTLGEDALAQALADPHDHDADKPRIRHDVDCVAGVLTVRAGRRPQSIETSGAVFCTTSGPVIRNVQRWYREQGEGGAPPIVHLGALTSIAWVKKPQVARDFKMHELAALCVAALRPTRETWNRFLANVRQLRKDDILSDDESVALVASEMTEPLLASIDDDSDPDADTISEVIERVKAFYGEEAQKVATVAIQQAESEASQARQAASTAMARADRITRAIDSQIERRAKRFATTFFMLGVIVTSAAALVSIPGVFEALGPEWKKAGRVIVAISVVVGAYSQIHGPSLKDLRLKLQACIAKKLRQRSAIDESLRL